MAAVEQTHVVNYDPILEVRTRNLRLVQQGWNVVAREISARDLSPALLMLIEMYQANDDLGQERILAITRQITAYHQKG